MKILRTNYLWLLLCVCVMAACDPSDAPLNGYIEETEEGSSTMILKGYEDTSLGFSVFQPADFDAPFYIKDKMFYGMNYQFAEASAGRLDALTEHPDTWQSSIAVEEGRSYWAKYISMEVFKYVKFRVAYIQGNNVGIEYVIDSTEERPNVNANVAGESQDYPTDVEMPALEEGNFYVEHTVETGGEAHVLNYALEWNSSLRHANWVAFYFDALTAADYVERTDDWNPDPLLPDGVQTDNSFHTNDGFDRGHLCASEDRVWSEEANEQTFYFSNITPQLGGFNQHYWAVLERRVQTWGRSLADYDRVYVTKGGTLNQLLVNFTGSTAGSDGVIPTTDANGFTRKGLACPANYFIAVLAQKGTAYQAIAFLVPHREDLPEEPTADQLQEYAMSVSDLEQATGLDFYCNLPDDLETEVENSFNVSDWSW